MSTAAEKYAARFAKVLQFVDAHLQDSLQLEELSAVASFSKYHFHRQFAAYFGMNVFKYVQLLRLKRASYRLAYRSRDRVTDIALTSGYEGSEAFARAFRKTVGQSPSAFRRRPHWAEWSAAFAGVEATRSRSMNRQAESIQVSVTEFPTTKVALLEHRGDPRLLGDSIRQFIEWRKAHKLHPSISATFNLLYHDEVAVPPDDFRFGLCAATDIEIAANEYGIVTAVIPGGRCARVRHVGGDATLRAAAIALYSKWLPDSGEELRDFPLFLQRVRLYPDVPEHEAVTDIFLPLK